MKKVFQVSVEVQTDIKFKEIYSDFLSLATIPSRRIASKQKHPKPKTLAEENGD